MEDSLRTSHSLPAAISLVEAIPLILNMKLDATDLRYVTSEEFRVLTAVRDYTTECLKVHPDFYAQVEMGSKNHEVVPTVLISQIAGLRGGGTNKLLGSLAKRNLVSRVQNSKCEYSG